MSEILLDTSVIIDFLRTKEKEKTLLVQLLDKQYDLCCSIVTYAELYAGSSVWNDDRARELVEGVLSSIKVIPIDIIIAKNAGKIRHAYNLDLIDSMIAATAIAQQIDLCTLNIKDFVKVRDLSLI